MLQGTHPLPDRPLTFLVNVRSQLPQWDMAPTPPAQQHDFDVAVSFAGEDRDYVEDYVERLKAAGVRVFYDNDFASDMWGEDLVEYFDQVFRLRSRFAVIFVSSSYAEKMWTRHERRSALARGLKETDPYVLPIKLDETTLDGLRPTLAYLDARRFGLDGIVKLTLEKLSGTAKLGATPIDRVPRSEIEEQLVLLQRPPCWEYLYFGGRLLRERMAIEDKYRDHQLRYVRRTGEQLNLPQSIAFVRGAANDAQHLAQSMGQLMSPEAQAWAFGKPGEPGDSDNITHLAKKWNSIYEGFLDWAATIRATRMTSELDRAKELLARYADGPIKQYRDFINQLIAEFDALPTLIAAQKPVTIELKYTMAIPDEVAEEFLAELRNISP